ncbi:FkbM family methyltransferase [Sphingomonas sp. CROZ-RG-20F-R02-07]|uniref:FkbM family methyltransferase n=1 Tax=Sphingomonas sp. CROZ-RG-20F-R02-07 TaxID=2914832 RepID=UPI001F57621C|nr:FkbM family methyltransferase [Sphingomonas sp. CROZ-RG-20F-R02-07]
MINDTLAQPLRKDGRDLWQTLMGQEGHVVYGPYVLKTHGVYQVDFELALADGDGSDDIACATIEITGDFGNIVFAERPIRTSDLSVGPKRFSLLAVLRQIHQLEFRIHVNGARELLVDADPVLTRVSAILDEPPRAELGEMSRDLELFAQDTRRILRLLRPQSVTGFAKVRLGKEADGGYTCIDDFAGIDTAFSFGINDDISWDLDAADRGLTIHQFDHTVADPAPHDSRMIFQAKRIDRHSSDETQALGDLIRRYDKRRERPNLVLKMDIEGGEWDVLDATSEDELARLAWIVCELHYFQGLAERHHREIVDRCLQKIGRRFAVVHVHSNVWGGYTSLANTVVPNVIEVTLVNRALYDLIETHELFPGPLDQCCDPEQPDFHLGAYAF